MYDHSIKPVRSRRAALGLAISFALSPSACVVAVSNVGAAQAASGDRSPLIPGGLLLSRAHHWSAIAGQGRAGQDRFLLEANHRLGTDGLHHTIADDPLLAWLRTVNGHRGRVAADPKRSSPLLKGPALRLPGWEAPTPEALPRRRMRMSAAYRASLAEASTDNAARAADD
jgi:hypothetical protein